MSRLIRLSEDRAQALIARNNEFSLLDVESNTVLETFSEMPQDDSWVDATSTDRAKFLPLLASGGVKKRQAVKQQPRDHQGRWVAAGANVKWRSNNQLFSGTVDAIKDGKAIVSVRNKDGSISQTTLMPSTLQVMATKARLKDRKGKEFQDPNSDTEKYINDNEKELTEAAKNGGALVKREDGYSFSIHWRNRDSDPSNDIEENPKEKKSKSLEDNAYIYQLYSPSGNSLGIFGPAARTSLDSVIASDKAGGGDIVVASAVETPYAVPKSVQESILSYMEENIESMDYSTIEVATRLCSGDPVSKSDVDFIYRFFEGLREYMDLYGGASGDKWSKKIMGTPEDEVSAYEPIKHNFMDETYSYFVYGDSSNFVGLIAVDELKDKVYGWTGAEFGLELGPIQNFDAEIIEAIDAYTAFEVASLLHGDAVEGSKSSFSLMDIFPDERNLFSLAQSELDFGLLDTVSTFAYNSGERSLDAQKQARGGGGKFGKVEETTESLGDAKYFAIVDEVDPTAVMDVVAIVNQDGNPTAFKRIMGGWVPDAELLLKLSGATPPPVSVLADVSEVKEILTQVDSYDSAKDEPAATTASGFDVNGEYFIGDVNDLYVSIYSATQEPVSDEVARHIVKRAQALNRMDVVPEDWRVQFSNTGDNLYGEYGEVLTASAGVQGLTAKEKLENYWLTSDKVDWTSNSAVDYATLQLGKYLSEDHARAFATILKAKANTL